MQVPVLQVDGFIRLSHNCLYQHRYSATLADGEKFSYTDRIQYYGTQSVQRSATFRGATHTNFVWQLTSTSGPSKPFTNYWFLGSTFDNGAVAIHEYISVFCYRGCS